MLPLTFIQEISTVVRTSLHVKTVNEIAIFSALLNIQLEVFGIYIHTRIHTYFIRPKRAFQNKGTE